MRYATAAGLREVIPPLAVTVVIGYRAVPVLNIVLSWICRQKDDLMRRARVTAEFKQVAWRRSGHRPVSELARIAATASDYTQWKRKGREAAKSSTTRGLGSSGAASRGQSCTPRSASFRGAGFFVAKALGVSLDRRKAMIEPVTNGSPCVAVRVFFISRASFTQPGSESPRPALSGSSTSLS